MSVTRYTPESDAIVKRLCSHGFEAYYVGGCVRDRLLGISSEDVDIATNANLSQIKTLFPYARVVGEAFSVALIDGVEVATFRIDGPYSDYRHPDYVTLVNSITDDLGRRDFTINAMAESADGSLIDPYNGRRDLANALIRFVGDPLQRLREDPIRAVRACRFVARLNGRLESESRSAIHAHHDLIAWIARERMQLELNKIILLDNRETALFLLAELNLLHHILPRLARSVDEPQNYYHAEDCWVHAVKSVQAVQKKNLKLRLAVLLHDIAKPLTRVCDADGVDHFYNHEIEGQDVAADELRELHYSRAIIDYVKEGVRYHMSRLMFCPEMKDATIRRLMGKMDYMPVRDLIRLQIADLKGNLLEPFTPAELRETMRYALQRIRKIEAEDHALKISDLAVTGTDVMRVLDVPAGPLVGDALRFCFENVTRDPERNTREELLHMLEDFKTTIDKV